MTYIQAVDKPATPPPPKFISAVGGATPTVTVQIEASADSRGVDVAKHEIWIDAGDSLSSAFTLVPGYNGISPTYTITTADGLGTAGKLHRIRVTAENAQGISSDPSPYLLVQVGPVPQAPAAPTKDVGRSGDGEIMVTWSPLSASDLPLLGYRLYSDFGLDHNFVMVYDGLYSPSVNQFLMTNVTGPLVAYSFYLTGINFNGEGPPSPTSRLRSCTLPSAGPAQFSAPQVTAIS